MTWWGVADVVDFARVVGFSNPAQRDAAALAMLATNGADHYESPPLAPAILGGRGVYALVPDALFHYSPSDLFNPIVSTRALMELYRVCEGSFDFHPLGPLFAPGAIANYVAMLDATGGWRSRAADRIENRRPD